MVARAGLRARRGEPVRRALTLGNPTFGASEQDEVRSNVGRSLRPDSELDAVRLFGHRLQPLPGSEFEARLVGASLKAAGFEGVETRTMIPEMTMLTEGKKP